MLTSLQVRNFAIIDQVEVEFEQGMTVLTGETGAGKSILVDAMGLVLGERGGTGLVRGGAQRAEFCAEFDLSDNTAAKSWLVEQALDLDHECLLRRVINADGRSRAFINGNAVPLQSLKTVGEMLLDIHGQHFHQSLGKHSIQRDLLDYYGDLGAQRQATESAHGEWQRLAGELRDLEGANADRLSRLELLEFQAAELEALNLRDGELDELHAKRQTLQHSGRLLDGTQAALDAIFDADTGNAHSLLSETCQSLQSLCGIDPRLEPLLAMLQDASIQISEAAAELRRYGDSLQMDPALRDQVEERLDAIQTIARKHRLDAAALPDLLQRMRTQLAELEDAEQRTADLVVKCRSAEDKYRETAARLSTARHSAARGFSSAVSGAMTDLGMAGGVFETRLGRRSMDNARAHGLDDIEFMISANPGQEPMPLSKVASGGELSRMSLAIQVIASDGSNIPTMVFDEVDSGVGGGVAEMVGQRLRELGESRQVFCVTHLAQVAGLADNHFRIIKISDGKSTRIGINELNNDERIEELARMLGGVEITQRTRDHAAEMLDSGSQKRHRKVGAGSR